MEWDAYKTPDAELRVDEDQAPEKAHRIAARQRALLWGVLAQILVNPLGKLIGVESDTGVMVLGLIALGILVYVVVAAVRLSLLLNSNGVTVLLGILSVVPLINLIVLLILSRQSTKVLKASGMSIGLMGARPARTVIK